MRNLLTGSERTLKIYSRRAQNAGEIQMWIRNYTKLVQGERITVELETALPDGRKTLDVLVGIFEPCSLRFYEDYERYPYCYESILYVILIKIGDKTWQRDFFPSGGVKFDGKKTASENWVSPAEVLSQARDRMSELASNLEKGEPTILNSGVWGRLALKEGEIVFDPIPTAGSK